MEEVKNDLGIKADDVEAIKERLVKQGIADLVSVDLFGSVDGKSSAPVVPAPVVVESPAVVPEAAVTGKTSLTPVESLRKGANRGATVNNPTRAVGGATTFVFG